MPNLPVVSPFRLPVLMAVLAAVLIMTGCASHGRFNLDMDLSEAAEMATQSSQAARQISSEPSFWHSHSSSVEVSAGPVWFDNWDNSYEHRLLFGRQYGINIGVNQYRLLDGYRFQYGARMDDHQFRIALSYSDAAFQGAAGDGLNSPRLLGFEFGAQWLQSYEPVAFALGGQINSSLLIFNYDNSLLIDGYPIDTDSLGIIGFGFPAGMIIDLGSATLEAMVTPTLAFHNGQTEVGLNNDIFTVHYSAPVSVALGWRF